MNIFKFLIFLQGLKAYDFTLYKKVGTISKASDQSHMILKQYSTKRNIIISELTPEIDLKSENVTNDLDCHLGGNITISRNKRLLKKLNAQPQILQALKEANFSLNEDNIITFINASGVEKDNSIEIVHSSDESDSEQTPRYNLRKRN